MNDVDQPAANSRPGLPASRSPILSKVEEDGEDERAAEVVLARLADAWVMTATRRRPRSPCTWARSCSPSRTSGPGPVIEAPDRTNRAVAAARAQPAWQRYVGSTLAWISGLTHPPTPLRHAMIRVLIQHHPDITP